MSHIVDLALNTLIAVLILAVAWIIFAWVWGVEQQHSKYHPLERSCGMHIVCRLA